MRTVFYDCQTSSNTVVLDRATGTMWREGVVREWTGVGNVNVALYLKQRPKPNAFGHVVPQGTTWPWCLGFHDFALTSQLVSET